MRTTQAAAECKVTLNTIRNWTKDYGAFLSPGATVTTGTREFTGRDIEILKYIAVLRSEGMQRGAIMQRLGETTFAEIDEKTVIDDPPDTILESHVTAVTRAQRLLADESALPSQNALERRVERLEQSKEPSFMVGVGIGFIAACLVFLLLVGLALLYAGR